jgi:hypothetical protein
LLCRRSLLQQSAIANFGRNMRSFKKFLSPDCRGSSVGCTSLMSPGDTPATTEVRSRSSLPFRRFHWLFGAVAGAFLLAGALAPRADADVLVYFNFEGNTFTSVPAPGPGGLYPLLQNQTILNSPTDPFPPGGLLLTPLVGTILNELIPDVPTTNTGV